jgi:N-acylglucosamine 2-epimerase
MFSRLFNEYQQRPEWLEMAQHGAEFLLRFAPAGNGKLHFRLRRDGRPLASCLSIYTECFAIMGLAELSRAGGDTLAWSKAVTMYQQLQPRLGLPSDTPFMGYPLNEQFHLHGHDMMRLTVAWALNEVEPNTAWRQDIASSVNSVLQKHWKPDLGALLENVATDGSPMLDLPEGRMFHPGHSIETAWMLMEVAAQQNDPALLQTAIDITLCALQRGWDQEFGGLRYLTNLDGTPLHAIEADMKLWWPHSEALYALLLAWALTGRADLAAWYERMHTYTFNHFPDAEQGEWFGYLNRDGSRLWTAKANGWKGFFHIPRVLFRGYQLLDRSLQATGGANDQQQPASAERRAAMLPRPHMLIEPNVEPEIHRL